VQSCERRRHFGEAEAAKRKLQSLYEEMDTKKLQQVRSQQLQDVVQAEEAHQLEFQEQRDLWEDRLRECEAQAEAQMSELELKHRQQMRELAAFVVERLPPAPRPSSELLNLAKIEASLIKKQDYLEAKKVARRISTLQEEEQAKWDLQRRRKLEAEEGALLRRQQVEQDALQIRLQSGYNQLSKERSQAIEQLLLKYQNMKKELSTHHKLDLHRASPRKSLRRA